MTQADLDSYVKKLEEVHQRLFPNIKLIGLGTTSAPSADHIFSFNHRFSEKNEILKYSEYYYDGKLRFIHYTSSPFRIFDVLNSGTLRLQNFKSLNDPMEFVYSAGVNGISELIKQIEPKEKASEILNAWRERLFPLSMCEYHDDESESFEMWRHYGNSGKGAALVLEFDEDNRNMWNGFYLAKVKYGEDHEFIKRLKDWGESLSTLHQEYLQFKDLDRSDILPNLFKGILGFNKTSIWNHEAEIRLIVTCFHDSDPDTNFDLLEITGNRDLSKTHVVKLPLYKSSIESDLRSKVENLENQEETPFNSSTNNPDFLRYLDSIPIRDKLRRIASRPRIRIKKVLLGYDYKQEEFEKFTYACNELKDVKKYDWFSIEQSRFVSYFK